VLYAIAIDPLQSISMDLSPDCSGAAQVAVQSILTELRQEPDPESGPSRKFPLPRTGSATNPTHKLAIRTVLVYILFMDVQTCCGCSMRAVGAAYAASV
jgi:hypothetical protein